MPLILGTNSIKDTGYNVANSLRFNDDADKLSRTPSSDGNQQSFTVSFWSKRGKLGANNIMVHGVLSNSDFMIYYNSSDQLQIATNLSGTIYGLNTDRLFRDPSAWLHIVVSLDTTSATASSRIKVYINGSQETSLNNTSYPPQNSNISWNKSSLPQNIGHYVDSTSIGYKGYIAEFVNIDGSTLTPTSFGEFDEDSPTIWKPKDVSGLTFGTNGFYLDFENSGALGTEVSGNSNTFTVTNLSAIDQSTDTCTNNFATLNPNVVIGSTSRSFEEGNLTFKAESTNWTNSYSTLAVSQGKWYAEMKIQTLQSSNGYGGVGIVGTNHGNISSAFNTDSNSAGIELDHRGGSNINIMSGGSNQGDAGEDFEQGKIVGLAVDMDNRALYISEDGTYLTVGGSVGNPTSGSSKTGAITIPTGIDFFAFAVGGYSTDFKGFYNFGSPAYRITSGNSDANGHGNFEYSVPSGYFSLCTKNLAEFG